MNFINSSIPVRVISLSGFHIVSCLPYFVFYATPNND